MLLDYIILSPISNFKSQLSVEVKLFHQHFQPFFAFPAFYDELFCIKYLSESIYELFVVKFISLFVHCSNLCSLVTKKSGSDLWKLYCDGKLLQGAIFVV